MDADTHNAVMQKNEWAREDLRNNAILINIGGSANWFGEKDIPFSTLVKTAEVLLGAGFTVIFSGVRGKPIENERFDDLKQHPRLIDMITTPDHEKLSVQELFALLGQVRMIVSVETGTTKISAIQGTPTLEIYKATHPATCAARGPFVDILQNSAGSSVKEILRGFDELFAKSNKAFSPAVIRLDAAIPA